MYIGAIYKGAVYVGAIYIGAFYIDAMQYAWCMVVLFILMLRWVQLYAIQNNCELQGRIILNVLPWLYCHEYDVDCVQYCTATCTVYHFGCPSA